MKLWWVYYPNGVAGTVEAESEQDAYDAAQWRWGRLPEYVKPVMRSEMADVL